MNCLRWFVISFVLAITGIHSLTAAESLKLERGQHISIIGNTLAERMQHDGWLEVAVQSTFPQHELVVRDLGYSGDELTLRLRSAGFGTPDEHLTKNKTDVVFAFFGYNESFGGEAGLDTFKKDLRDFIDHTLGQQYNGRSAPQLVLFSPVAHENLGDPNLPDGKANNERLELYTRAMQETAKEANVVFVDLFHPTLAAYDSHAEPLSINGVHLNEAGHRVVAQIIHQALFADAPAWDPQSSASQALRAAVQDKNFFWFQRYRTTDGYSIFGGRADLTFVNGQTNRVVMQREMEILDVMTANRDRRIWAVAQGKDLVVDDSNTPDFLQVITNKPGEGPGGKHIFLSGEESIQKMTVASGMKVELFASEEMFPELVNPVQMAFDTKGRLWVATWQSYPHWKPKEKMDDRLLILEDTNGDGKADQCKTFVHGLHNPTGFEFYGKGVLVAVAPDLVYLEDVNGDDRADIRRSVLHGLDSADTHHGSNSFVLDPGGALYFQEGTFHHTQVETPHGPPVRSANAAVFRFVPRTSQFEVYVAYGFANPHGHVFDRWGQDFIHDGTGAVPYHGALFSGHLDFPNKHGGPPTLYAQRTRPCPATEIVSTDHFPPEAQGNLLVGNVIGFQGVLQYRIKDRGASFVGEEVEPIVYSTDPNFRPTDMEIAPDGSLYLSDWQNPIIGHMQHNLRDPSRDREHGRVYRLHFPNRPLSKTPAIAGQPIEELVKLLAHPTDRVRYRAKIELAGRDTKQVLAAANQWIQTIAANDPEHEHHWMELLWLHEYHHVPELTLLKKMLSSDDFRARSASVRVLCNWRDVIPQDESLAMLKTAATDAHPRVRLEAVRAASFYPVAQAIEIPLISAEHPTDEYLDYVRNETMRALEPFWQRAIAAGESLEFSSEAGMKWLLARLPVEDLIKMKRTPLVYRELLTRPNVLDEYRREALNALSDGDASARINLLLDSLEAVQSDKDRVNTLFDLGRILASWDAQELSAVKDRLRTMATSAESPVARQLGFVGLVMAQREVQPLWDSVSNSVGGLRDLVGAIPLIPDLSLQDQLYQRAKLLLEDLPQPLQEKLGDRLQKSNGYGRYVRIELPGRRRTLTLAEVQVFSDGKNIARQGKASQSATAHGGSADKAIDGNTSGTYGDGGQTHTPEGERDPWWELDLGDELPIESINVMNRTDGDLGNRLDRFTISVLDGERNPVFLQEEQPAPKPEVSYALETGGPQGILRRAVIQAAPFVRGHEAETFRMLATMVRENSDRGTALQALSRIPRREWPQDQVASLLNDVLEFVRAVPAEERNQGSAAAGLQLADALVASLPAEQAGPLRRELRQLGVLRIRLGTVPHRMVYDQDRLVVEAGKPVEVSFENLDIMPHNFVIITPGSLEEVGTLAESSAAQAGAMERHYVPQSDKILVSSRLLQPRDSQTLQFQAPTEPGVYPFVCTYPGHWRRMYGSLFVVRDLERFETEGDSYLAAEKIQPQDELLKMIRPSQQWKLEDLAPAVAAWEDGRSFAAGRRMFQLATCISCHRMNGEGNEIGPDLTKLDAKLKPIEILQQIVEPSHQINKDYQSYVVELKSGQVFTGLIVGEDTQAIKLLDNPLASTQARRILLSEIETREKSMKSIMPEGLLDKLTRDEILDLLSYIYARGNDRHEIFGGDGGHGHHHH